MSTLEELLASAKAVERTRVVTIPELGTLRLRAFSLREFHEMQQAAREADVFDVERWETLVLQHGIADPALSYDEAAQLTLRPAYLVQQLVTEIGRLSGLDVSALLTREVIERAEATFSGGSAEVPAV
ncbi:MAG: hypothetical protein GX557_14225 [Chloroflexi bacterium]|nr:hypothetical protein [Chloroflexota bacterium]